MKFKRKVICFMVLICGIFSGCGSGNQILFYVSPKGDDSYIGNFEKPFRNLEFVQQKVRQELGKDRNKNPLSFKHYHVFTEIDLPVK